MNILIYFPYNLRSVEQQSVMEMLVKNNHKVVLLTSCERGYLHEFVEKLGVIAEAVPDSSSKIIYYFKNLRRLSAVIKKYNIDIVIAHQQIPALIGGILRKLLSFHFVYVRHNTNEDYQFRYFKPWILNSIVNSLTPVKIAPSEAVKSFWINYERVNPNNIRKINYGYNFSQYELPSLERVKEIRNSYQTKLLILSLARLVPAKRHREMFLVIKQLIVAGVDCKLICLGAGELEHDLKHLVSELDLTGSIFLLGRKQNVFDYIEASDVFLHLSVTEASNSAVKEVGLTKKPVIVCRKVGDFEDYIIDGENGFLVDFDNPVPNSVEILKKVANAEINKEEIGRNLYDTVTGKFDIKLVAPAYQQLLYQWAK